MTYSVKEIFYTLQGEGVQTGCPAVFLRFTGCNLWSGREEDRTKGPGGCSKWCDTDFLGIDGTLGGQYKSAKELAAQVQNCWPTKDFSQAYVVCTGGEPLLQIDAGLLEALHAIGFRVAIETNGTRPIPPGIDWVCVSPKAQAKLLATSGDELKLVFPQAELPPHAFEGLDFRHFMLQPMDGPNQAQNTLAAVQYCLAHPRWRISLQTHKLLNLR